MGPKPRRRPMDSSDDDDAKQLNRGHQQQFRERRKEKLKVLEDRVAQLERELALVRQGPGASIGPSTAIGTTSALPGTIPADTLDTASAAEHFGSSSHSHIQNTAQQPAPIDEQELARYHVLLARAEAENRTLKALLTQQSSFAYTIPLQFCETAQYAESTTTVACSDTETIERKSVFRIELAQLGTKLKLVPSLAGCWNQVDDFVNSILVWMHYRKVSETCQSANAMKKALDTERELLQLCQTEAERKDTLYMIEQFFYTFSHLLHHSGNLERRMSLLQLDSSISDLDNLKKSACFQNEKASAVIQRMLFCFKESSKSTESNKAKWLADVLLLKKELLDMAESDSDRNEVIEAVYQHSLRYSPAD
ncbi:hypothetical protein BCR33DRAFT_849797 [Rhizoclosmatium globosum]|uniref:BZIP domain-containing protein n=1 Tax=Rhizoclosmatium globosum TaxID=329046 RepID=A0A1Y2CEP9_9FUNG|nr:hypothetical protein BCR33DRAFT_849797 [Rhizoclosmatium globosum]|eukprot:ORY45531.1 hypothetical protein BCR33DRAFT_849797 [Rhizoclosmatium globosum]